MIGIAIVTYVAFILFIIYVNQFDYPWFSGYLNIFGVTVLNLFLTGLILWQMFGKKLNPHQAYEDRTR